MKSIIFACLLSVAFASSGYYRAPAARTPSPRLRSSEVIEILRDDRVHPDDGSYSFNVETQDGIQRSESGKRLDIENNPTGQQGSISFTFPNGESFDLKFVADEGGYQPESSWLPVAPAFPHPIPQFVLDQIEKAAREDAEAARSPSRSAPRSRYSYDDSDEK